VAREAKMIKVCQIRTYAAYFRAFLPLLSKLAGSKGFEPSQR
jgi:hypothetical protein